MILKDAGILRSLHRVIKGFKLDQRGSVLVLVMVVILTATLLGLTLGHVAMNDQLQAVRQQRNNEAYYIARSGAEAMAALLLEKLNNSEDISVYLNRPPAGSELGRGRFEADVIRKDDETLLIRSTGYSGDYSEKVNLSIIGDATGGFRLPVLDMAVFAGNKISLGEAKGSPNIEGNTATNITAPNGVMLGNGGGNRITGNLYIGVGGIVNAVVPNNQTKVTGTISNLDQNRTYPMPDFPGFPTLPARGSFETDKVTAPYIISQDGHYEKIKVESNRTLTIDVGSGIRRIRVDHLEIPSGHIVLTGSGQLILYVDLITFSYVRINVTGNMENLLLCYRGAQKLNFSTSIHITGYLFTDIADLFMGSNVNITGGVFVGGTSVEVQGGSDADVTAFYAPKADFTLGNGGWIKGGVVCMNFTAMGNGKVTYNGAVRGIWDIIPELDFGTAEGEAAAGLVTFYRLGDWSG